MELGVGMFGDNHYDKNGKPQSPGNRLQELIEEIKLMDLAGYESITHGQRSIPDKDYGHVAVPNSQHEIIKLKFGKEMHRTTATIDSHGFRISSASHRAGKSKPDRTVSAKPARYARRRETL